MVGVDCACVGSLHRSTVSVEFVVADLVWELLSFRMEIEGYPSDVVFSRVGMSNLFADSNFHLEHLICLHSAWALYYGYVFFHFPICFLDYFSKFLQYFTSEVLI